MKICPQDMTFSKIDKKVLIILIIAVAVILLVGFMLYKSVADSANGPQNLTGGAQTENGVLGDENKPADNTPQIEIKADGVQAQGGTGTGMLTVCLDKCGDGICQATDSYCSENNSLNCICVETPQECPQDCK